MLPSAGVRSPNRLAEQHRAGAGSAASLWSFDELEAVDLGGGEAEDRGVAAQPGAGRHRRRRRRWPGRGCRRRAGSRTACRTGSSAASTPRERRRPSAGRPVGSAVPRASRSERPATGSPSVMRSGVAGAAWRRGLAATRGQLREPGDQGGGQQGRGRRRPSAARRDRGRDVIEVMPGQRAGGDRVMRTSPQGRDGFGSIQTSGLPSSGACDSSIHRPSCPPRPLAALGDLAGNLRWSWHPETQDVFAGVDPELWESTGRDPVRLLGAVSRDRLDELAATGLPREAGAGPARTSTAT